MNRILTYVTAIFVLVLAGIIVWYFVPSLTEAEDEQPNLLSSEFYGSENDPVIRHLLELESRGASRDEVIRSLPLPGELALEVYAQDITSDDKTEHIVMRTNPDFPTIQRRLANDGYVGQVEGMIIYKNTDSGLQPVFTLTPYSMRNQEGTQLIGQIVADYGYAIKVTDYDDPQYYERPVKIITLVILDANGQAASDELTVYWDPGSQKYKATNTFGAPGTFD